MLLQPKRAFCGIHCLTISHCLLWLPSRQGLWDDPWPQECISSQQTIENNSSKDSVLLSWTRWVWIVLVKASKWFIMWHIRVTVIRLITALTVSLRERTNLAIPASECDCCLNLKTSHSCKQLHSSRTTLVWGSYYIIILIKCFGINSVLLNICTVRIHYVHATANLNCLIDTGFILKYSFSRNNDKISLN